ncbi:MAG: hypothetical protein LBP36_03210 [Oscillospiraceae bacterium]|nr:hypothetical protein [Oscillospiraceae bacterium]
MKRVGMLPDFDRFVDFIPFLSRTHRVVSIETDRSNRTFELFFQIENKILNKEAVNFMILTCIFLNIMFVLTSW